MIGNEGVHAAVLMDICVKRSTGLISQAALDCAGWNWVMGDVFIFPDMAVNYLSPRWLLVFLPLLVLVVSGFC